MGFLLTKLLPLLLYPLGLAITLQTIAILNNRRRWSPWCACGALVIITLPAMPIVSDQLVWSLEERSAALTPNPIPKADAILVLGGGLKPALAPRAAVEVSEAGDRLLTGLRLFRQNKAALLITSGAQVSFNSNDPALPEALSARNLAIELGIPAKNILTNPNSRTTAEETKAIAKLGKQKGWQRILLVTSAIHMPRALASFNKHVSTNPGAQQAIEVVPVSCDYQLPSKQNRGSLSLAGGLEKLVPDAKDLYLSSLVIKEYLGLFIYQLKGDAA